MITDQDINMIHRGYQYASGSQSTGWAEPLPNEVLFFLKANTLKVKPLKLAAGVVTRNHGLTSIICFLAEAVELLLCCKVKKHKINICSITVTILRRQSSPRFCSIVLAIMIFQRFKIYDVPFLALDLAAFFAPACLCFAKQDKWSTHIWTSSLLRRVVLAKVSIVFSSISWPCLALLLNADLITSLGGEN